jgi:hypothetical protein
MQPGLFFAEKVRQAAKERTYRVALGVVQRCQCGPDRVASPLVRPLDLVDLARVEPDADDATIFSVAFADRVTCRFQLLDNPARPPVRDAQTGSELPHGALSVLVNVDRGADSVS